MLAYVLISLEKASERKIVDALSSMPHVEEAHILFGEWDVIAKVKVKDADALATYVMDKVRKMPGVKLTSTLIAAG